MTIEEFKDLKIGELVEVVSKKTLEKLGRYYGRFSFTDGMLQYCGEMFEICDIDRNRSGVWLRDINTGKMLSSKTGWNWIFDYRYINHKKEDLPLLKMNFDALL